MASTDHLVVPAVAWRNADSKVCWTLATGKGVLVTAPSVAQRTGRGARRASGAAFYKGSAMFFPLVCDLNHTRGRQASTESINAITTC